MKIKLMLVAVMTLVVLNGTKTAIAGGDIPLMFSKWHGIVEIKPLSADCGFQTNTSAPERRLSRGWQRIQKGAYYGKFLVRTGKHSWVQINDVMCVESNSLLTTDGLAEGKEIVHRGKVTAADGKPGPSLPESAWLHYATKH